MTTKKLKILYIGFGLEPFTKGGAVLYQEQLIKAVVKKDMRLCSFCPRLDTL